MTALSKELYERTIAAFADVRSICPVIYGHVAAIEPGGAESVSMFAHIRINFAHLSHCIQNYLRIPFCKEAVLSSLPCSLFNISLAKTS